MWRTFSFVKCFDSERNVLILLKSAELRVLDKMIFRALTFIPENGTFFYIALRVMVTCFAACRAFSTTMKEYDRRICTENPRWAPLHNDKWHIDWRKLYKFVKCNQESSTKNDLLYSSFVTYDVYHSFHLSVLSLKKKKNIPIGERFRSNPNNVRIIIIVVIMAKHLCLREKNKNIYANNNRTPFYPCIANNQTPDLSIKLHFWHKIIFHSHHIPVSIDVCDVLCIALQLKK